MFLTLSLPFCRVITRLVTLASDVLNDSSDPSTVSSWGGNDWCGWTVGAMRKADDAGAQEKLMKAFKILKTHCEDGGVEKTKVRGGGRGEGNRYKIFSQGSAAFSVRTSELKSTFLT